MTYISYMAILNRQQGKWTKIKEARFSDKPRLQIIKVLKLVAIIFKV